MREDRLFEILGTTTDTRMNPTGTWRYFRPVIADRQPPCAAVCPAGNNIREFVQLAAEKDFHAALAAVKKENPLPSTCGRVCHHPCTANCSRNGVDSPLAVNLIERKLGDMVQKHSACLPAPRAATGKTVAVVGSGPAGLAWAYHAALLGHTVTIFESESAPGGMLRWGIPAYRLPRKKLDGDLHFIDTLGIELRTNHPIQDLKELDGYDAVCLALGAHASRRLDIPNQDMPQVWGGLSFLRAVNSGDAPDTGKRVIVIGGGNTAMDCARAAMRLGAKATVCYRRTRGDMPALPDEIAEAEAEGVAFEFQVMPSGIDGKAPFVTVEFTRTRMGEPGPDGRCRPEAIPGSKFELDADTVITALGEMPETGWLPAEFIAKAGALSADPITCLVNTTARSGLFAAGDASAWGGRTVSHAIGAGKRAAIAMDIFLNGEMESAQDILARITVGDTGVLSSRMYRDGLPQAPVAVVAALDINKAHVLKTAPVAIKHLDAAERMTGFDEVNMGWSEDDAAAEAGRCMRCGSCTSCGTCLLFCPDISVIQGADGRPDFDSEYCKGCGICLRECPRGGIVLVEEEK
jgi:NADPH-dependent glutamate synthase beta subunit-like oxidoreductase